MTETSKTNRPPRKKAEKPAPAEAATNNTAIEDITHEEVHVDESKGIQLEKTEVLVLSEDDMIKRELIKFNFTDQKIAELKENYGNLTITGPDDKEGYKAVKAAWNLVRGVRTGFEKKGLELRNGYKKIQNAISGEEDRLIDLVTPLEQDLEKKWKAIDDEKEKAKKDKEEAEQKRLMNRLEELVALGMRLENGFYCLGETISMDAATLRALPEDQYNKLKQTVENKAAQLAEQKRLLEEEEEKKRKQLEADQLKVKQQQEALDKEKNEMRQQRREIRVGKFELLGMNVQAGPPEVIVWDTIRLALSPILDMDGEEFNQVLHTTTVEIKNRKDETARKELAAENKRVRTLAMEALDMELIGTAFVYDDDYHEPLRLDAETIFTMELGAWADHVKELGLKVIEYKNAKVKHDREVKAEQEELDRKKKLISEVLETAGLGYNYRQEFFFFSNDQGGVTLNWNDVLPLTDDEIQEKGKEVTTQVADLKKKSDDAKILADKKKKDDEKLAMKDKDRFFKEVAGLEAALGEIKPKEYKTKAFQLKAQNLVNDITEALKAVDK